LLASAVSALPGPGSCSIGERPGDHVETATEKLGKDALELVIRTSPAGQELSQALQQAPKTINTEEILNTFMLPDLSEGTTQELLENEQQVLNTIAKRGSDRLTRKKLVSDRINQAINELDEEELQILFQYLFRNLNIRTDAIPEILAELPQEEQQKIQTTLDKTSIYSGYYAPTKIKIINTPEGKTIQTEKGNILLNDLIESIAITLEAYSKEALQEVPNAIKQMREKHPDAHYVYLGRDGWPLGLTDKALGNENAINIMLSTFMSHSGGIIRTHILKKTGKDITYSEIVQQLTQILKEQENQPFKEEKPTAREDYIQFLKNTLQQEGLNLEYENDLFYIIHPDGTKTTLTNKDYNDRLLTHVIEPALINNGWTPGQKIVFADACCLSLPPFLEALIQNKYPETPTASFLYQLELNDPEVAYNEGHDEKMEIYFVHTALDEKQSSMQQQQFIPSPYGPGGTILATQFQHEPHIHRLLHTYGLEYLGEQIHKEKTPPTTLTKVRNAIKKAITPIINIFKRDKTTTELDI
jgi:hypothetical protein